MHVVCSHCRTVNRVPDERAAQDPVCGHCGRTLLDGHPVELTDDNFDAVISRSDLPIVVDFWAAWCGPCRRAAPEVHALAGEMAGRAVVLKVDTEAHPELAERYRVQAIPNFVVLAGGQVALQRAGLAPRAEMRRWLEQAALQRA